MGLAFALLLSTAVCKPPLKSFSSNSDPLNPPPRGDGYPSMLPLCTGVSAPVPQGVGGADVASVNNEGAYIPKSVDEVRLTIDLVLDICSSFDSCSCVVSSRGVAGCESAAEEASEEVDIVWNGLRGKGRSSGGLDCSELSIDVCGGGWGSRGSIKLP